MAVFVPPVLRAKLAKMDIKITDCLSSQLFEAQPGYLGAGHTDFSYTV